MKALSLLLATASLAAAAPPVISNIRASQRPGTKLVDVYYDLADADGDTQLVQMAVSSDAGLTYGIPCVSLNGAIGSGVALGADRKITWNAGADWNGNWVPQCRVRVTAHDGTTPPAPPGMAYIPGGPFQMGDNFNELGEWTRPVHNVEVSAFFIDKKEVTRELWEQVKAWGNANGYFIAGGAWKDVGHPVHSVNWFQAVQWCNARSEMEGLTPSYYSDLAQVAIYRGLSETPQNATVKWNANGYRLPTEAEWEKAARGGRTGMRYPWGNTIAVADANYAVSGNPWQTGSAPGTSPVGSYTANDFGLFDVTGNLWEWTWDWFGSTYYGSPGSSVDPTGPASGSTRAVRGSAWNFNEGHCGVAYRGNDPPGNAYNYNGFRTVRR